MRRKRGSSSESVCPWSTNDSQERQLRYQTRDIGVNLDNSDLDSVDVNLYIEVIDSKDVNQQDVKDVGWDNDENRDGHNMQVIVITKKLVSSQVWQMSPVSTCYRDNTHWVSTPMLLLKQTLMEI